ncbi:MAG: 3-hydroxybutyryl-CoA dehydrogenase [Phycisphaerales bacterium]|nr:3-hydroxybutyryl-CoA dehydrogenase [Phycisphaerales bacterium]
MPTKTTTPVAVLGAGTMGRGIVQVFAQAGYPVRVFDAFPKAVDDAVKFIGKMLDKAVEKGKATAADAAETKSRIQPAPRLADLSGAKLIIEAATEKLDVKIDLLKQAQTALADDGILASNTSSISITQLAAATARPDRFIGMHFFNPVPLMKLVEVVRGLQTSGETAERTIACARDVGKTPVSCNDHPGFVSNRVLMPMINEAVFALMEGVAEARAIDDIMKLGCNHPMGPLELADLIGLDVCLMILEVLHRDLGEDRYRPCPLLRKMVHAGRMGRKSGQGFYKYE